MNRWFIAAAATLALAACDQGSRVAGPGRPTPTADVAGTAAAIYIVNFDETLTTEAAVTAAILNAGAGVVQFNNFSVVAAPLKTKQLLTIAALPGLERI